MYMNIAINHIVAKDSLGYNSVAGSISVTFIGLMQLFRDSEFGEITQNNGLYAFQSHLRSPILVIIESPYIYATSS